MQGLAGISRPDSVAFYSPSRAMPTTAIYASRILTPHEEISDGVIIVEGSRIAARRPSRRNSRSLGRSRLRGTGIDGRARICRPAHPRRRRPRRDGGGRAGAGPDHVDGRAPWHDFDCRYNGDRSGGRNLPEPRRNRALYSRPREAAGKWPPGRRDSRNPSGRAIHQSRAARRASARMRSRGLRSRFSTNF